jgi:hypothetical protein
MVPADNMCISEQLHDALLNSEDSLEDPFRSKAFNQTDDVNGGHYLSTEGGWCSWTRAKFENYMHPEDNKNLCSLNLGPTTREFKSWHQCLATNFYLFASAYELSDAGWIVADLVPNGAFNLNGGSADDRFPAATDRLGRQADRFKETLYDNPESRCVPVFFATRKTPQS